MNLLYIGLAILVIYFLMKMLACPKCGGIYGCGCYLRNLVTGNTGCSCGCKGRCSCPSGCTCGCNMRP